MTHIPPHKHGQTIQTPHRITIFAHIKLWALWSHSYELVLHVWVCLHEGADWLHLTLGESRKVCRYCAMRNVGICLFLSLEPWESWCIFYDFNVYKFGFLPQIFGQFCSFSVTMLLLRPTQDSAVSKCPQRPASFDSFIKVYNKCSIRFLWHLYALNRWTVL